MTTAHELKTAPPHFQAVWDGRKPFEIRLNDRDYNVGDVLHLRDYYDGLYLGREVVAEVTYILPGGMFGVEPGYVAMGILTKQCRVVTSDRLRQIQLGED